MLIVILIKKLSKDVTKYIWDPFENVIIGDIPNKYPSPIKYLKLFTNISYLTFTHLKQELIK